MPTESRSLEIGGQSVEPGDRVRIDHPIGRLPTQTKLHMRIEVVRGTSEGPCVWIASAVHGDELNGVEIVRRIFDTLDPQTLSGTVIAVPIVNVYGFLQESRYLPDRRDLNRSFPGNFRGSLASQLADVFMHEVVEQSDYGLDLHTAARGRYNLPQIRGDFEDEQLRRCARAFAAPLMYHTTGPKGALRRTAGDAGCPTLLYEGGEAGRFDDGAIQTGVDGTLRTLEALEMIGDAPEATETVEAKGTTWIRAPRGGVLRLTHKSGEQVQSGEVIGNIGDALGDEAVDIEAIRSGIIISHATHPLVNQGDAIVHLAEL